MPIILRQGWIAAVVFALALSTPPDALARPSDPRTNSENTELSLRLAAIMMNSLRTPAAMIALLPRKTDREYLLKLLGGGAEKTVSVRYVERCSIVIETSEARAVVSLDDLERRRFQLNQHAFIFDPNEPAEAAVKRIRRSLAGATTAYGFLEPQAHANPGAVALGARVLGAIYGYVSVALMTAWLCGSTNQNSVGKCLSLGAVWPVVLGFIGVGSLAAGLNKLRERAAPAAFDLDELKCPDRPDEPIRASMRDEKKDRLLIELTAGDSDAPKKLVLSPEVAAARTIYFKSDMSVDTDKTTGNGQALGPAAFDLIAKGAKSLVVICQDPDYRRALEDYRLKTKNDLKVVPNVNESGISAKTIK